MIFDKRYDIIPHLMEEENYQKELFDFEKPKRAFPGLAGILPKRDFEGKVLVSFTLEKIVFLAIGMIMAMVVVFALGVEKGKSLDPYKPSQANGQIAAAIQPRPVPVQTKGQNQPMQKKQEAALQPAATSAKKPYAAAKNAPYSNAVSQPARSWTIVTSAFKEKSNAVQEADRLKKEGFDATIMQDEPYFIVCVGAFQSKENAGKALSRLRTKYQRAYLKLR